MVEPGYNTSSSTDTLKDSPGPKAAGEDIAEEEVVTMAAGDRFWKSGRLAKSASQVSLGSQKSQEAGGWRGGRLFKPLSQISIPSVLGEGDLATTRLARKSIHLLEEKVEAIERDTLAPSPPRDGEVKPLKAMLWNLWVLAIMVGIVAIIIVSKDRIHAPEPLLNVHATNGIVPFILPLEDNCVDYLFMNIIIGPPTLPDESSQVSSGSGRRRLAAWVGQAVTSRLQQVHAGQAGPQDVSTGGRHAAGSGYEAADAELALHVRKLLARPKLTLSHRRLLEEGDIEEPSGEGGTAGIPELKVSLMQRNASSSESPLAAVKPYDFRPVSDPQACTTKEDAAVKCSMTFRGSDLNAAYVEGQPLYLGFESSNVTQLVFEVEVSELGGLGPVKNWLALAIILCVVLAIASERIHRMWAAMVGAACMMSLLLWMNMAPSLGTLVTWVDESTLTLLFGMMIIVGRLKDTGVFELVSAWSVQLSRGKLWLMTTMLMISTAFVSAWLDNVTTMLLVAPVSVSMMRLCNKDPVPLLMSQALMSNIGGTATMVGDPPALIIGNALSSYIGFMDFIYNMAPGVIMASVVCIPLILYIYRKTLTGPIQDHKSLMEEVAKFRITNWPLFAKCSYVTVAVLVGFLTHAVHHVDPSWFAVLGAITLCICDQPKEVENVVRSVEFDLLLFFAAMFVAVEASAEIGMIDMIGGWLESAIRAAPEGSRTLVAIQILLWVSMLISGVLDNIPYTITMVPVIEYLASAGLGLDLATLAWALNFGACFGGNATLIGASANIVTATLAERAGMKLTFNQWLVGGIPVSVASVAMADVWMILRFCL